MCIGVVCVCFTEKGRQDEKCGRGGSKEGAVREKEKKSEKDID